MLTSTLAFLRRPALPSVRAAAGPGTWLAVFCVLQVVLWSLAFGLTYSAPEMDSAEQFVWSFSVESGYWKHFARRGHRK